MVGRIRVPLALLVVMSGLCCTPYARAQAETSADTAMKQAWVAVSGTASLSTDFYAFSNPEGTQLARRPASLVRLSLAPTLSLGSWFSLPLHFVLTMPETNVTTPALQSPSFTEMFANPINQLGMTLTSQKLNGSRVHLGTHTPKFSELSGGDLQLFGAGVDIRPGPVQLAASGGIAQRAVAPDSARGIRGAFRRDMYMARLALGTSDTGKIGLNVVYTSDDRSSLRNDIVSIVPSYQLDFDSTVTIPTDTIRVRAEEGIVASLDGSTKLFDGATLTGEVALSAFTGDTRSDELVVDQGTDFFSMLAGGMASVFTRRVSTRADLAGTASVIIRQPAWGITVSALYMGAGFMPLGYPFAQSDRVDLKVSPMLRLFDGDLSISGTVGQRINNLSETKGEALTQFIANGLMNIRFSDAFSLSASYANFGIRSNNVFDTLKIQNVSQSFSIDPMVTIDGGSMQHTITGSVAFDTFDDFNVVTGAESSNDTRMATLTYTTFLTGLPLTVGAMGSYVENALFSGVLVVRTAGVNASYRFLTGVLTTSLSYTIAGSTFGSNPTDTQGFLKASARWNITKNVNLVASLSNNVFQYGQYLPTRGRSFSEQIAQLALNTTF